jgi:hypothetical protein
MVLLAPLGAYIILIGSVADSCRAAAAMSVQFASKKRVLQGKEDPNSVFFKGAVKSTLGPGELYLEQVGAARKRPKELHELGPEERRMLALTVYPKVIELLRVKRVCHYCSAEYTEERSLGRRECTWHPGSVRQGTWSCCGDPFDEAALEGRYESGCSHCDHSDLPYDPLAPGGRTRELPYEVALYVGVPAAAILSKSVPAPYSSPIHAICSVLRCTSVRLARSKRYRPVTGRPALYVANGMEAVRHAIGLKP